MKPHLKTLYRAIGGRIRFRREQADLSQAFLARLIGVTRASVSNTEAGRQRIPLDKLYLIATALQVPLRSLLPEDKPNAKIRKAMEADAQREARIAELKDEIKRLSR